MSENKRIYDLLQKHGVSAKLISRLLKASKKEPKVAKSYEPKTIYSIIHNNVTDVAVNDTLIFLENLCNNGIPNAN
jgi:hypothetical protein